MTSTIKCLTETATEMLEAYGTPCVYGRYPAWAMQGFRFDQFSANEWGIFHNKMDEDRTVDESTACRIIYALTVGADCDVIRESLEVF